MNLNVNMKFFYVIWMPQLLTVDQKPVHVTCFKAGLQQFQQNPQDFRRRFVTVY